jgi:hypothetical protein
MHLHYFALALLLASEEEVDIEDAGWRKQMLRLCRAKGERSPEMS